MSQKQKTIKTTATRLNDLSQQLGIVLMSAAMMIGLVELHDRTENKIVVPSQPSFATATNNYNTDNNPLRREREEVGAHYVSYSENQRTPSRAGKF